MKGKISLAIMMMILVFIEVIGFIYNNNNIFDVVTRQFIFQQETDDGSSNSTATNMMSAMSGGAETSQEKNKNLVVFNALGMLNNVPLVENTRRHIFRPQDGWECIVFLIAKEDTIPNDNTYLENLDKELGCTIVRTTGNWGIFLQYIYPGYVNNYDNLALVLDDIFFPVVGKDVVNVTALLEKMQRHDIDVIQPTVYGDTRNYHHESIVNGVDRCLVEVNLIETYAQIFSSAAWECYYKMLHHSGGKGWCYDMCFKNQCPHLKFAVDFSMEAWHIDRKMNSLPEGRLNGTNLTDWRYQAKDKHTPYHTATSPWAICKKLGCKDHSNNRFDKIVCHDDDGVELERGVE